MVSYSSTYVVVLISNALYWQFTEFTMRSDAFDVSDVHTYPFVVIHVDWVSILNTKGVIRRWTGFGVSKHWPKQKSLNAKGNATSWNLVT